MALGPELENGRTALVLISDDNTGANQKTRIVVVSIDVADLVGD